MSGDSQPGTGIDAHQLSIIIKMMRAQDPKTRDVAVRALKDVDPEKITALLSDPELTSEAAAYFARHAGERRDWIEALLANPSLSDEDSALLTSAGASTPEKKVSAPGDEAEEHLSVGQRIARMNVGQKIKAAMQGDKEVRTILIKDTNREVYKAVLNNPGLKEAEVEMMAKNTGTSTEILRAIAANREWVANRNIMHALVMNPKTPVNLSIRFLSRLGRKEIEFIAKSRSMPQALRNNAKRIVSAKSKGK
ncbi:MAG: hypothetical protein P1S46_00480 [bacterium]|nr:hypothetical protein [bacterium]MDT8394888.1 hypothetical protein [bacterium]